MIVNQTQWKTGLSGEQLSMCCRMLMYVMFYRVRVKSKSGSSYPSAHSWVTLSARPSRRGARVPRRPSRGSFPVSCWLGARACPMTCSLCSWSCRFASRASCACELTCLSEQNRCCYRSFATLTGSQHLKRAKNSPTGDSSRSLTSWTPSALSCDCLLLLLCEGSRPIPVQIQKGSYK